MQFLENEIRQYTELIWSSLREMEIRPFGGDFRRTRENSVMAGVQINGTWNGAVCLDFSSDLACQITEKMFNLPPGQAGMEEILDAISEVTNMIGGNLKSLLPEPNRLFLPIVAMNGHSLHFPGTERVSEVIFYCQGKPFSVSIYKSAGKPFLKNKSIGALSRK